VLARFPEVERRLREEVSAVLRGRTPGAADLANLDYTRMVIQETLRLFPPTWRLARTAIGRDDIGGHAIARNSIGVFSPYLVHRHADFWDEPEAFRPERFAPENSIARPRYAYIPFGGGPRACVGSQFAMMEMQLVVAAVAQAFHLRLAPGYAVEPEPVATLRPRHGLMMRLEECTTRGEASRAPLRRSLLRHPAVRLRAPCRARGDRPRGPCAGCEASPRVGARRGPGRESESIVDGLWIDVRLVRKPGSGDAGGKRSPERAARITN
jgi:hypothetical protein